jgi:long-chain acyl-CoA synthetase
MRPIAELFSRLAHDTPDRVVIHAPAQGLAVRAAELWKGAVAFASLLQRQGVEPGRLLLLPTGNDPRTLVAWLACRIRGVVMMPVDRSTTVTERDQLLAAFHPVGSIERLEDASATASSAAGLTVMRNTSGGAAAFYPDAALLKLTSGSTGDPKAIRTTEAQLVADGLHIMAGMGIGPDDVQIGAIPLSHSYGIGCLVMPLLTQGTAIVLRDSFVPHEIPGDAATHGARIFCGVPFMFDHFVHHPPSSRWPSSLNWLISAGARLERRTQRRFRDTLGVAIHSFYGTSETGGIAFEATDIIDDEDDPAVSVGVPLPGVSVALRSIDEEDSSQGQIHVTSDAVASGYLATEGRDEGFVDGGFLTGDLGRIDADGRLCLTARVSTFVNVAGRKVQPEEVERVLRAMPGVAAAHVLGIADARRGELLVACVVPRGGAPSIFAVRQHCSRHLSPHKVPRWLVVVESMPITERGKLDRKQLEAIARASLAGTGSLDMS